MKEIASKDKFKIVDYILTNFNKIKDYKLTINHDNLKHVYLSTKLKLIAVYETHTKPFIKCNWEEIRLIKSKMETQLSNKVAYEDKQGIDLFEF